MSQSTNWSYVVTLGNSIIGVSVLAMPYCFEQVILKNFQFIYNLISFKVRFTSWYYSYPWIRCSDSSFL